MSKVVRERPAEGIITVVKSNKNSHRTKQPIVQIEGMKTGTIKFGNRGGEGGGWCYRLSKQLAILFKDRIPAGTTKTIAMLMIGPRGINQNMVGSEIKVVHNCFND